VANTTTEPLNLGVEGTVLEVKALSVNGTGHEHRTSNVEHRRNSTLDVLMFNVRCSGGTGADLICL